MAENYPISTSTGFLIINNRVFLPSTDINIFPCSRRGQVQSNDTVAQYDPEARLNTERTNRLHTALNGFKDSFIIEPSSPSEPVETLRFVLAGYYIEAKDFAPAEIANDLNIVNGTIYAHLSLHGGISLSTRDYYTEILYRQSDSEFDKNYLDVSYGDNDFFVGVSFTADKDARDTGAIPYVLPLFSNSGDGWKLVQTSLLPKIEHGETSDSIRVPGDATFNTNVTIQNHLDSKEATIETITVPYTKKKDSDIDTSIKDDGVYASYVYTKSLAAEGISVEGEIRVVDDLDNQNEWTEVTSDGIFTTGDITVRKALNVQKATDATDPAIANIDKAIIEIAEIEGTLTATGDATLKSNLKVEDNINVGTPATPATADDGGYIVAEKDITAEQDLIAKRDIKVTKKATIESLVVGERASDDSTETGTITAKKLVKTPTLKATTVDVDSIISDAADGLVINPKTKINNTLAIAGDAKPDSVLTVHGKATIDEAVIPYTVTNESDTNTTIKGTGIQTPFIYAERQRAWDIEANALRVLAYLDDPSIQTTIGHTEDADGNIIQHGITTTGDIIAEGTITAHTALNITGIDSPAQAIIDVATIDELTVDHAAEFKDDLQVLGDLTVKAEATIKGATTLGSLSTTSINATDIATAELVADGIAIKDPSGIIGQVPALELAHLTKTDTYQLRFKFGTPITLIEE